MNDLIWQEIGYDSKSLERFGYVEGVLYVEFKTGSGYTYPNVPIEIYQRILNKECISKSEGRNSYGATFIQLVIKAGYKGKPYK